MDFPGQNFGCLNENKSGLTSDSVSKNDLAKPVETPTSHFGVNLASMDLTLLVAVPSDLIMSQTHSQLVKQLSTPPIARETNQTQKNNSERLSVALTQQIDTRQLQISENYCPKASVEQCQLTNIGNPPATPNSTKTSLPNSKQTDAPVIVRIIGKTGATQSSRADSTHLPKMVEQISNNTPPRKESDKNAEEKNSTSLQSFPTPKFRKILPKPQSFNPDTLPIVKILQKCRPIVATNTIPKPDILIIPKNHKTFSNRSGRVVYTRYPGNKRPILRISINKEYDTKKPHRSTNVDDKNNSSDVATMVGDASRSENLSSTEMTIENSSTNKAVTFKLDPKSGEIVVTTRPLDESTRIDEVVASATTEQKVDDNTNSSPANLRQLYMKGQRECIALRKKLRILRQRHKQEQDEIHILQEHLTELDEKIQTTSGVQTSGVRFSKRKQIQNGVQSANREISMRDIKKLKHDVSKIGTKSTKMVNNKSAEQGNR